MLANAPVSRAQDAVADDAATAPAYPAPAQTPEAAGALFYQFLAAGDLNGGYEASAFDLSRAGAYSGAISRAQMTESERAPANSLELLFAHLAEQKDEPQYDGKVVGTQGDQTLVEVSPAPARKRAVVVIAEDGGFRVDLKATFGRWNDLSGENLDIAWADATGVVSPALAKNPAFIEKRVRSSCQTNLKQAMLGVLQYSQDYGQNYPSARKWMDDILPYVRNEQIFRCPALPAGSNYGYALNQNLAGLNLGKMDNPAQTAAIYETDDLTRNAFGAGEERAYRHIGGSNIAFADGHIKWYPQGQEPEGEVSFKP